MRTTIRFFTAEQLGPTQSLTPEGFLLCQDVPLARTGVLIYAEGEVPVEAQDGIIRVIREPQEVFSPMSIASFAGKPVTNDHPPEKVSPENWREYSVGVCLNPRQGDGYNFDNSFLYADLLITDPQAIKDVREGKREVSAGYDSEYEMIRPGEGLQHDIVGNHIALVLRGRCGPRCAIGDSLGDKQMSIKKRPAWFDAVMRAHKTNDEGKLVESLEKITDMLGETWLGITGEKQEATARDEIHVHLHQGASDDSEEKADPVADPVADPEKGAEAAAGGNSMEQILQRLAALERAVAILAQGDDEPEAEEEAAAAPSDDPTVDRRGTKDKKATVGDSASLRAPWQELITRAEFLAPGIKTPTFDAKAAPRATQDAMCAFRRKVLTEALKEDDTRGAIEQLVGANPKLAQMTCDSVQVVFNGASQLIRQANTRQTTTTGQHGYDHNAAELTNTVRLINERNRQRFGIKA